MWGGWDGGSYARTTRPFFRHPSDSRPVATKTKKTKFIRAKYDMSSLGNFGTVVVAGRIWKLGLKGELCLHVDSQWRRGRFFERYSMSIARGVSAFPLLLTFSPPWAIRRPSGNHRCGLRYHTRRAKTNILLGEIWTWEG